MAAENPSLIEQLRESLVPQGTANVVRISLPGSHFDADFVQSCITELERKALLVKCELETFSPLDILALEVLRESAGIERK